uniref:Uncharacterized protein n=1 Tax=Meloidogyne enterolobii TaxID=390850 RepID=A0A6V7V4R1_MELEN|nr:unnamed protein product [Meloidogyne enterolobii]
MHNIHYSTIKYLIKNSQKIQKFFENQNSSKNRLYILIGNELGNLEIEYPFGFQLVLWNPITNGIYIRKYFC